LLLATNPSGGWTQSRRPKTALQGWSRQGPVETGNPPQSSGVAGSVRPGRREAATQALAMTPITPPGNTAASDGAATRPKKKKAKTKAAKASAGEAVGGGPEGGVAVPFAPRLPNVWVNPNT